MYEPAYVILKGITKKQNTCTFYCLFTAANDRRYAATQYSHFQQSSQVTLHVILDIFIQNTATTKFNTLLAYNCIVMTLLLWIKASCLHIRLCLQYRPATFCIQINFNVSAKCHNFLHKNKYAPHDKILHLTLCNTLDLENGREPWHSQKEQCVILSWNAIIGGNNVKIKLVSA